MTESENSSAPAPDVSSKEYLRKIEQAKLLGVHPRTVSRLAERDPTFPPEIELMGGLLVRSVKDLKDWLEAKKKVGGLPVVRKRSSMSGKDAGT